MKQRQFLKYGVVFALLAFLFPEAAVAYIGPGAGISAIGAFLAVVAGVTVAIFGFVWYPFKRLMRMRKKKKPN